jgi:hypothetical protein
VCVGSKRGPATRSKIFSDGRVLSDSNGIRSKHPVVKSKIRNEVEYAPSGRSRGDSGKYSHAPNNDVSVNDGPHIRRWSLKPYSANVENMVSSQ